MENSVEKVFSCAVIEKYLSLFNLENKLTKLGDFENYVYEVTKNESPYILRITHSSHRNAEDVFSEVDWMNYLHENGVNVPNTFSSIQGKLMEKVEAEDGTCFFGCLFSKANGKLVKPGDELFNEKLLYSWGKEIGKMHRLTKEFQPTEYKRPHWYDDDLLEIENYIPDEALVNKQAKKLINELHDLPRTKDNYGLIHNDIHQSNFFYDGNTIEVFDFDDACYCWFASDIAIPLYYTCMAKFPDHTPNEKATYAKHFLDEFMKGYQHENQPPQDWEKQVSTFLRLRDISLFSVLHKKIDVENRTDNITRMIKQLKQRIEGKQAIVAI